MQVGHGPLLELLSFNLAFPFLSSLTVTMLFSGLWQDCFPVSNLFFSTPFWHLDSSCAKSDFTVTGRQLLDVWHLINFAPNYKQCWPITKGINILVPWLSHRENGCLNKSSKSNYHIVCIVKCEAECRGMRGFSLQEFHFALCISGDPDEQKVGKISFHLCKNFMCVKEEQKLHSENWPTFCWIPTLFM